MAEPLPDAPQTSRLKVPPHSIEAEQSVLGGIMLDNAAWERVADKLEPGDFYRPNHRVIFGAMRELADDLQPLDVVTLSEALRSRGLVEKSGGVAYLAELAESTPAASNVRAYADIVRERSTLRQLLGAANEIAESAFAPEGRTSAELLNEAEQAVFRISEGRLKDGGPRAITPLLTEASERIDQLSKSGSRITGLATGFADLDEKTAGFQPSDLIVIAGRPAMGKTALAVNIAEYAVMHNGSDQQAVVVFSMEQPTEQLVIRILSSLGPIDQEHLRRGQLRDEEWDLLGSALGQLRGRPLYIDDTPALTPNDIRTRTRRVAREAGGVKLVVVDYMQLMRTAEKAENRTLEISEISRNLKALAKEMRCPVVALSQLNRSLESREDKRPRMSDLRESGAIEQDADVILFIYREEVYKKDTEKKGLAELIIGKQRNGPIGTVELTFTGNLTKFETYVDDGPYEDTYEHNVQ
ncbi:MAG: replicative DNA helicase [Gammaproteobacteria bacterium]|nr:replicative DNA helicase [Gammaproteobacteria bacterium]